MIKKFFRMSDKRNSYGQVKPEFDIFSYIVNTKKIIKNFIEVFGKEDVIFVCDNCKEETIQYIKSLGFGNIIETSLGPHEGFRFCWNKAIELFNDNDIVYFVEDDYWHLKDSEKYIMEGLSVADYVSIYDSLDKYIDGGNNPMIWGGGEDTKVILTKSSHWKITNATTMTFAVKVKTMNEDFDIMNNNYRSDFRMFGLLRQKGRRLINSIPGKCSHIGYEMSPFIDWVSLIRDNETDPKFKDVNSLFKDWIKVMGKNNDFIKIQEIS